MTAEKTVTVSVWDRLHKITVHQKSKTVWIAVGKYMGRHIEVKAPTQGSAVKQWAVAARTIGG